MFEISLLGRFCSGHCCVINLRAFTQDQIFSCFNATFLSFLHDYNQFEPSHISSMVFIHVIGLPNVSFLFNEDLVLPRHSVLTEYSEEGYL